MPLKNLLGRRTKVDTQWRLSDSHRGRSIISRRRLLKVGTATGALTLIGGVAGAKRLDQDMDPYIFGITEADLQSKDTIMVFGPCEVPNPPESVDLHVQVRGDHGARALGDAEVTCDHEAGEADTFEVPATVRGTSEFSEGDEVTVCAKAHVKPDSDAAAVIRWCKDIILS